MEALLECESLKGCNTFSTIPICAARNLRIVSDRRGEISVGEQVILMTVMRVSLGVVMKFNINMRIKSLGYVHVN